MRLLLTVLCLMFYILPVQADQRADHFLIKDGDLLYEFKVDERWFAAPRHAFRADHAWLAPGLDQAGCAIHTQQTDQFRNIGAKEHEEVVRTIFTPEFFESHVPLLNIGQNNALNISLAAIQEGGLGRGFSRYALVDYTAMSGIEKRAIMFASLYYDVKMVVSCQAAKAKINAHMDSFMTFVHSITHENRFRPYPTLYYRDFLTQERSWLDVLFDDLIWSLSNP